MIEGQKVRILHHGQFVSGILSMIVTDLEEPYWWVQLNDSILVFPEKDIIEWNNVLCECGSEKVGISNRHAQWCPKDEVF